MAVVENADFMNFGAGVSGDNAVEFGLWSELTGGIFYGSTPVLNSPRALQVTEGFQFSPGSMRIRFPRGIRFQEAFAVRVATASIQDIMYISVHDAAADNGANEITGTARIQVTSAGLTVTPEP